MKKITTDQMLTLEGGLCVIGPGNSNGNAAVNCTGLCLAGFLSFIMSDGHSNVGIILC
jgi:hypothetical protein